MNRKAPSGDRALEVARRKLIQTFGEIERLKRWEEEQYELMMQEEYQQEMRRQEMHEWLMRNSDEY